MLYGIVAFVSPTQFAKHETSIVVASVPIEILFKIFIFDGAINVDELIVSSVLSA